MKSIGREKRPVILNDEETEYIVFQPGDRVQCSDDKGTVESTSERGLFVNVKWDEGVTRGRLYTATNLHLINCQSCGECSCK